LVTVALPWRQNLTPASRRQDHTTSPSASHASRQSVPASTASRPASVTIAIRPSVGRDGAISEVICLVRKRIYFLNWGWTAGALICPSCWTRQRTRRNSAEATGSVLKRRRQPLPSSPGLASAHSPNYDQSDGSSSIQAA